MIVWLEFPNIYIIYFYEKLPKRSNDRKNNINHRIKKFIALYFYEKWLYTPHWIPHFESTITKNFLPIPSFKINLIIRILIRHIEYAILNFTSVVIGDRKNC